jgi:hypothetical protein
VAGEAGRGGEAGLSGAAGAGSSGAGGEAGLSGAGGQGGTGGSGPSCALLDINEAWSPLTINDVFGGFGTTAVLPDVAVPGGADEIRVELYGQGYGLPTLAPGVFDLADEPSYDTCQHCVTLYGYDVGGTRAKVFYPVAGLLELVTVSDPPTANGSGSLQNVILVEIQEQGSSWSPVPGGECLTIGDVEFVSTP